MALNLNTREVRWLKVMADLEGTLERALEKSERYASAHEALGVFEEELHEFRLEVFKRREARDPKLLRQEALDVAAACLKYARQLT